MLSAADAGNWNKRRKEIDLYWKVSSEMRWGEVPAGMGPSVVVTQ